MKTYTCARCGKEFRRRSSGRQARPQFCSQKCYHAWRYESNPANAFDQGARKREYEAYKRALWGGSGKGANEVGPWARPFGAKYEEIAVQQILPHEGFTEVDNRSAHSSMFFIDFVATDCRGQRVLIDATTKWSAYVPQKVQLARSLRMPLYILHISPANPLNYCLTRLKEGQVTSKVPMAFFHKVHQSLGCPIPDWPDETYHNLHTISRGGTEIERLSIDAASPSRPTSRDPAEATGSRR